MSRSVVVTGGSGLLGATVVQSARSRGIAVSAGYHRFPLRGGFAMDDAESFIAGSRPAAVIHCAAVTNVDWCEANPQAAHEIHAGLTARLAAAAQRVGAGFVYISTDSVFDGTRGNYREDDATNPLNIYARTKLEGETAALDACERTLVVRTNLFGWNLQPKQSLAEWVLARLEAKQNVPGFTDVRFSPLLVNDLADLIFEALGDDLRGRFHLGASDGCSKFEFARMIAEVFGFDRDLVTPSTLNDAALAAPRPRDTTLDSCAIAARLGRKLPTVREGIERMRRLRDEGYLRSFRTLAEATDGTHPRAPGSYDR